MSQGIKAVLPWMTFVLSIILCAFLIYVAFFSYQAGKAPTVNKVEANITLVLAIILAILVGLLMIWSIIHLYQTNKTKTKSVSPKAVENTPVQTKPAEAKSPIPIVSESDTVTKPAKITRVTVQPQETYIKDVNDPGASSALQDLLRSATK